jgi:hypothetical protein
MRWKRSVPALVFIFLASVLMGPGYAGAVDKRQKHAPVVKPAPAPAPAPVVINDINLQDYFRTAEDQLKKGKVDEADKVFQAIYDYTRDGLTLMKCVKAAYEKALSGQGVEQSQREDLYLKLQRINTLSALYTKIKGDSAYQIGVISAKKGSTERARKYLLEVCQNAPFSLDPASPWMKSKNLLLTLSNLEGEF